MSENLQATIDAAWEDRDSIGGETKGAVRQAVDQALAQLDTGAARVAEPDGAGGWRVNQWLKKAVLLSFRRSEERRVGKESVSTYRSRWSWNDEKIRIR